MKLFSMLVFVVVMFSYTRAPSLRPVDSVSLPPSSDILTVDFCDLLRNPQAYDQKLVRTRAIYRYGGEDLSSLYCPDCVNVGSMRPTFADATCTKPSVGEKLSIQKHSDGTVRIVIVGQFDGKLSNIVIQCVERADFLTKDSHLPDRMSPKDRKRVRCN
jgi:hypothetical protein